MAALSGIHNLFSSLHTFGAEAATHGHRPLLVGKQAGTTQQEMGCNRHIACVMVAGCSSLVGVTPEQQQAVGTRPCPQFGPSSLQVIQQITEQLIAWLPETL